MFGARLDSKEKYLGTNYFGSNFWGGEIDFS